MNQTTFETEKDARDFILKEFPVMATHLLSQVQPDKPNYYEGLDPVFVYTGTPTDPTTEFIITPYETEHDGMLVFGIRFEIPNIESAIDYIIHTNANHMIDETSIMIAYHAEKIGEVLQTDQDEGKRRMMKFGFIESYIQSWIQGLIDKCRGWSPYRNAIEYMQAMQSDNKPPTTPVRFF